MPKINSSKSDVCHGQLQDSIIRRNSVWHLTLSTWCCESDLSFPFKEDIIVDNNMSHHFIISCHKCSVCALPFRKYVEGFNWLGQYSICIWRHNCFKFFLVVFIQIYLNFTHKANTMLFKMFWFISCNFAPNLLHAFLKSSACYFSTGCRQISLAKLIVLMLKAAVFT